MSIYTRGDTIPFIITGKSVGTNPSIFGHWKDEEGIGKSPHRTDMSRLVADGGSEEIEALLATLPCPLHGSTGTAICGPCADVLE
jgi:hypothetical protein